MVHRYLRAIGFSEVLSRKQMQELIQETVHHPTENDFLQIRTACGDGRILQRKDWELERDSTFR